MDSVSGFYWLLERISSDRVQPLRVGPNLRGPARGKGERAAIQPDKDVSGVS
ncbi:MAG: hypothetical protein ABSF61_05410 [Anaerolineales bacterium]|jgi:hypothetical protein